MRHAWATLGGDRQLRLDRVWIANVGFAIIPANGAFAIAIAIAFALGCVSLAASAPRALSLAARPMLRFLLVLLSVTESGAVRPNNALERRRAALCVQAATAMWTAASSVRLWASNADEEDLIDMLVLIAGETLIRRQLFVPGEMRFSVGRLQSLFSQVHSFTDTVANVVANFRFQVHDLHRLRTGARKALRPPSHDRSTHSCARLPPHAGLRIPDILDGCVCADRQPADRGRPRVILRSGRALERSFIFATLIFSPPPFAMKKLSPLGRAANFLSSITV